MTNVGIALVGTLDTKGSEYMWLAEELEKLGCRPVIIDVGVTGEPQGRFDVSRHEVAAEAGTTIETLIAGEDRGAALAAMSVGASTTVRRLIDEQAVHGVLSVAGSGGSSIAAAVMQGVPLGFPKLLVSTMASGDVQPYVGAADVTLMYSVVDIAGINRVSRMVLGNAVGAIAGMAAAYANRRHDVASDRPIVAASMFGVTTPAVDACRLQLEAAGYEVLVFHATGSGGRALEALASSGHLAGVLDLTTTELADELVGGVLTAGPDRVTAAGRADLPQVVSLGALDMVNFGPFDTIPAEFADRLLYSHNATVSLMRTSVAESTELGRILGTKLAGATGPTVLLIPLRGFSALDTVGGLFHDPEADRALIEAVRDSVAGHDVDVVEIDAHINDPEFAAAASTALIDLIREGTEKQNVAS